MPDTGEPQDRAEGARPVRQLGGRVARLPRASTSPPGITDPWFLFPMFGMGIGVLRNYAQLWQAGYSWRDVLTRPPAPDAVETTLVKGTPRLARQLPPPRAEEFGAHLGAIQQVQGDRQAILKLLDQLPAVRAEDAARGPADRERRSTSAPPTWPARCTRWTAA